MKSRMLYANERKGRTGILMDSMTEGDLSKALNVVVFAVFVVMRDSLIISHRLLQCCPMR